MNNKTLYVLAIILSSTLAFMVYTDVDARMTCNLIDNKKIPYMDCVQAQILQHLGVRS